MRRRQAVVMRQVNYLESVFQMFLGFLSEAAVGELVERCRRAEGGEAAAKRMTGLLGASADELIRLVQREGDDEDKIAYLNVFLWGQAHGQVAPELRASYTFEDGFYNWLIHRQMVANGYEWERLSGKVSQQDEGERSYLSQIEEHLSTFESSGDLEDASHLAMLLNVIGPEITRYAGVSRALNFTRCLVERRDDEDLRWLNPAAFAMLTHDLSYPPADSWPLYRDLIRMEHNLTIFNYHGWLLGLRTYGQRAQDELGDLRVPGGYDLLEALATK